jgi:hypothetical protein
MQEPLSELLEHLKTEIHKAEQGAPDREALARLAGELERRVGEEDAEGLVDELRQEVQRFEASHPRLSEVIGRTADALSAIGL